MPAPTRVVLVCGSLGERSANRAALDVVAAQALDRGAEVATSTAPSPMGRCSMPSMR